MIILFLIDIDIDIIGDTKVKDIERNFRKLGMKLSRKVIYNGKVQQIHLLYIRTYYY